MIKESVNKKVDVPVIFEDGKTHIRGTDKHDYTCPDRVRNIEHSPLVITIFPN